MANDIATVTLTGRLGSDPDMKYTQDGLAITNVSLGNGKSRRVDNEWVENTSWYRLTAFGKLGETLGTKFVKGDPVVIVGEQEIRKFTGKDGVERTNVEVIVNSVKYAAPPAKNTGSSVSKGDVDVQEDTGEASDPW
jgi:single-strand DNA-binding protein